MVLKRQKSEIAGIGSAVKGLKMLNRKEISLKKHGASDEEIISIINILSFSLLNDNNVLTTKKINPDELTHEFIDSSLGMLVITPGHATSFYICDGVSVYFNDNFGKVKMDWKKHINSDFKWQFLGSTDNNRRNLTWNFTNAYQLLVYYRVE